MGSVGANTTVSRTQIQQTTPIPKSQVTVSSDKWRGANGKSPSGYGNWAFFMNNDRDIANAVFFTGKYADAKNQAIDYAAKRGIKKVIVGT